MFLLLSVCFTATDVFQEQWTETGGKLPVYIVGTLFLHSFSFLFLSLSLSLSLSLANDSLSQLCSFRLKKESSRIASELYFPRALSGIMNFVWKRTNSYFDESFSPTLSPSSPLFISFSVQLSHSSFFLISKNILPVVKISFLLLNLTFLLFFFFSFYFWRSKQFVFLSPSLAFFSGWGFCVGEAKREGIAVWNYL